MFLCALSALLESAYSTRFHTPPSPSRRRPRCRPRCRRRCRHRCRRHASWSSLGSRSAESRMPTGRPAPTTSTRRMVSTGSASGADGSRLNARLVDSSASPRSKGPQTASAHRCARWRSPKDSAPIKAPTRKLAPTTTTRTARCTSSASGTRIFWVQTVQSAGQVVRSVTSRRRRGKNASRA